MTEQPQGARAGASTDATHAASDVDGDPRRELEVAQLRLIEAERPFVGEVDTTPRNGDGEDDPAAQEPLPERAIAKLARLSPDRILARAYAKLRYVEGPNDESMFGKWYGMNHAPWCAMFVSWVFYLEGLPLPATTPRGFASCYYGMRWFQKNGQWRSASTKPKPGWVVFFDWKDGGKPNDHVGIVNRVNPDGRIKTIEGNSSNPSGGRQGVFEHNRHVANVIGYGTPAFAVELPAELPLLKRGNTGGAVRRVQGLVRAAYPDLTDSDLTLGGTFGPVTEGFVKRFQTEQKLEPDGEVGPKTWRALLGLRHQ
jgi:CHAP domain/Putative peptidoglycan binding domain